MKRDYILDSRSKMCYPFLMMMSDLGKLLISLSFLTISDGNNLFAVSSVVKFLDFCLAIGLWNFLTDIGDLAWK